MKKSISDMYSRVSRPGIPNLKSTRLRTTPYQTGYTYLIILLKYK
jgi:hypothetical protein